MLLNRDDPSVGLKNSKYSLVGSRSADGNEVSKEKIGESDMVLVIYLRPSFLVNTLVYVMIVILCYINGFSYLLVKYSASVHCPVYCW